MNIFHNILDFIFPRQCHMCGCRLSVTEKHLCIPCLRMLPRTNYHLFKHSPAEMEFWGQMPVERATAFIHYDGMRTRHIIHHIKYHHAPEIGLYLSEVFAEEIKESGFFNNIDCIVPVPLSWQRQWVRGYNQSEWIAKGISNRTGIPVLKNIVRRVVNNPTQTNLTHNERWENVQNIFRLANPSKIHGKHILLVDDVMTTGATIKACAKELVKASDIRISVATLCIAGHNGITADTDDEDLLP
ncbi:MAG: ComF family protein [Bacteroides sp.]|nr:ComF family protein [Roseburia sp.]MCM1347378.1 ComF family protein [Bacteroides sp.]MCM1421859.1 ComF family protein [Bacteroides sp.]